MAYGWYMKAISRIRKPAATWNYSSSRWTTLSEPIRLTLNSEADHSPTWSPQGRKIAFVSTRSGDSDIWLADLDAVEERFTNLSQNKTAEEKHPAWSPDGNRLSWASTSAEGIQDIYLYDLTQPDLRPTRLNNGDWSAWSPDGAALLTSLATPNRIYLSGFSLIQTVSACRRWR